MSIFEKTYNFAKWSLNVLTDEKQNVYFKSVAVALGYKNTRKAIIDHVKPKYKLKYGDFTGVTTPYSTKMQPDQWIITEADLYSLIFASKLPMAEEFKDWVCDEVLPAIRKHGYYRSRFTNRSLTFHIENERDLHWKVVEYIRKFYPEILLVPGLGELQDTKNKRLDAWKKGYLGSLPDIIIQNYHKYFKGFCIELKTPKENGILSKKQQLHLNGYKILVSCDYDIICREIASYCRDICVPCPSCTKNLNQQQR